MVTKYMIFNLKKDINDLKSNSVVTVAFGAKTTTEKKEENVGYSLSNFHE